MPHSSKVQSSKVREYLSQGMKPADIAKRMNIPVQRVYNLQYYARKKDLAAVTRLTAKAKASKSEITALQGRGSGITSLVHAPTTETSPEVKPKLSLWQRIKQYLSWL